ncbi:MAG: deaminated glutathione amidase, partial [Actinomycetota bacterium]|nr:deaminated glutathione amidase [Actinomycetota bacterium]
EVAAAVAAPTGVGGSLVSSPLGAVLAAAGPDPQLLICDVEVAGLPDIRKALPVLANRVAIPGSCAG